ncbi:MAG: transcription-repair coupling factor [Bacteroidota bacterium]
MNLPEILSHVQGSQQSKKIIERLQQTELQTIHLNGLIGSAESLQAAAIYLSNPNQTHFIVCNNKEEALYFQTDLESLLNGNSSFANQHISKSAHCFFFPDSFNIVGNFSSELNNNQVLERTEVLTDFLKHSNRDRIVVTYPEALMEKVVSQAGLQKHILHFKKGDNLDLDFVIELLTELNFDRTDFVYEPGQFSIRGGIVDIFSFGNELPYRVELFGKEVESIRTFDPATQLSNQNMAHVTIIPNTNNLSDEKIESSLFDFLPNNAIFWIKNAISSFELIEAYDTELDSQDLLILNPQQRIKEGIEKFSIIEFGTRKHFTADATIEFHQTPQPSFNKNFELLIDDLLVKQHLGFENLIFSDNPKQIERFYNIFDDLSSKNINRKSAESDLKSDSHEMRISNPQQRKIRFTPINIALHQGFIDQDSKLVCYTDHQIFERYHRYKQKVGYAKSNAISLKSLKELQPGDYVVHIDHGVGKYSGLQKLEMNGVVQEVVRIFYRDNDLLYVNINSLHKITKYSGKEGIEPKVNKLGSEVWEQLKRKTKLKVKELAFDLIKLYATRKAAKGFAFMPDTYLQNELESSFIYEDTPDQLKATQDVKADMEKPHPMDRLVCGDVGFGKTEIAIRAAFKAVTDGKQVAVLVPTTILAMQHAKTFAERLKEFPCTVEYVNRFKTAKEIKETLERLAEGKVDILIGTHMLLGSKIKFKDLGLMIIDEEQKFGVGAKDKLKLIKTSVDTLTLTATPIPRTLQFSMMGARDLSIINTPPPNRQPVNTSVHTFNTDLIKEAIEFEVYRGGQVYFIHNKVNDIGEIAELIRKLCPSFEIGVAHGQLDGEQLEQRMLGFINREYDVLVCTNIVESGLDIENANTIIINHSHHHGLSDLHQLRGRVGRNNKKAFCYLLAPPMHVLTPEARKRLQTIEQFSDLGSGFNISLKDLDIRGAGNLLGGEQSGFIAEVGFEMYHKILDEAIRELKETEFKDLFDDTTTDTIAPKYVKDCAIDTDTEMLIPDAFVNSINERLALYRQLDDCENEEQLQTFATQLADRFGPLPKEIFELFDAIRLRWVATDCGFERLIVKDKMMRCYFLGEQQSKFYESPKFATILNYINSQGARCSLKQTDKNLIVSIKHIKDLKEAKEFLEKMNG